MLRLSISCWLRMPCRLAVRPAGRTAPEPSVTVPVMVTLPAGEVVGLVAGLGEPDDNPFEAVAGAGVAISVAAGAVVAMGVSSAPGGGVISSAREKLQAVRVQTIRKAISIRWNCMDYPGLLMEQAGHKPGRSDPKARAVCRIGSRKSPIWPHGPYAGWLPGFQPHPRS